MCGCVCVREREKERESERERSIGGWIRIGRAITSLYTIEPSTSKRQDLKNVNVASMEEVLSEQMQSEYLLRAEHVAYQLIYALLSNPYRSDGCQ